jgi:hypothetical protein
MYFDENGIINPGQWANEQVLMPSLRLWGGAKRCSGTFRIPSERCMCFCGVFVGEEVMRSPQKHRSGEAAGTGSFTHSQLTEPH